MTPEQSKIVADACGGTIQCEGDVCCVTIIHGNTDYCYFRPLAIACNVDGTDGQDAGEIAAIEAKIRAAVESDAWRLAPDPFRLRQARTDALTAKSPAPSTTA